MPTTTNFAIPYPAGSATPNVPYDIQQLAEHLDEEMFEDTGWVPISDFEGACYGEVASGFVPRVRRLNGVIYLRGRVKLDAGFTSGTDVLRIGSTIYGTDNTTAGFPLGFHGPTTTYGRMAFNSSGLLTLTGINGSGITYLDLNHLIINPLPE